MPFGRRGGRGNRRWGPGGRRGPGSWRAFAAPRRTRAHRSRRCSSQGCRVPLGVDLDSGDRVDTGNSSPRPPPTRPLPKSAQLHDPGGDTRRREVFPLPGQGISTDAHGPGRSPGDRRPAARTSAPCSRATFERSRTPSPAAPSTQRWRIGGRPHQGLPTAASPGGSRPGNPARSRASLPGQQPAAGLRRSVAARSPLVLSGPVAGAAECPLAFSDADTHRDADTHCDADAPPYADACRDRGHLTRGVRPATTFQPRGPGSAVAPCRPPCLRPRQPTTSGGWQPSPPTANRALVADPAGYPAVSRSGAGPDSPDAVVHRNVDGLRRTVRLRLLPHGKREVHPVDDRHSQSRKGGGLCPS